MSSFPLRVVKLAFEMRAQLVCKGLSLRVVSLAFVRDAHSRPAGAILRDVQVVATESAAIAVIRAPGKQCSQLELCAGAASVLQTLAEL